MPISSPKTPRRRRGPARSAFLAGAVAGLVGAATGLAGCGDSRGAASAGAGGPEVPRFHAVEDLRIGNAEGDGPAGFGRITGLALDASGRVHVVDFMAGEVRVFSEEGDHLLTAGRAGSGPGELLSPCCAAFAPDGRLWVRDGGNNRFVAFEIDEERARGVATRPMHHSDGSFHIHTTFTAEGHPIDIGGRPDPATRERQTVLFHLDAEGKVAREILAPAPPAAEALTHAVPILGGAVTRYFRQPFGPRPLLAVGPGGMHAEAVSSSYEVRWHGPGGELMRVVSDPGATGPLLSSEQRARADSMIAADETFAGTTMPFSAPDRHPVIAALHFDNEGNLWVERMAAAGEGRMADVYAADGERVKQVQFPPGLDLSLGVVRSDRVVGVVRDPLGVPFVVGLRVSEGEG